MNKADEIPLKQGYCRIPCPLCNSRRFNVRYATRDYNWGYSGVFVYVECGACGLVYENPRPGPEQIKKFYPEYYGAYLPKELPDAENKINIAVHALRAEIIEKHCPGGALLDIGCGSGFFLEYMRRRGWKVAGLDPAPEHVDYARAQLGLDNIRVASWPAAVENPAADVVTMLHVLEHLESPRAALLAARKALPPAGMLVIETPNIRSWPARIFGPCYVALDAPRHLALFSEKTLQKAVELAGFHILELNSFSPTTMDYSESLRYFLCARGMRRYLKRRIGIAGQETGPPIDYGCPHHPAWPAGIKMAVKVLHGGEKFLYRALNQIAVHCGAGNNLLLAARKT